MIEKGGEQFLTEAEWAELRNIKIESLRVIRSRGKDAPYIKWGRKVVYRWSTVLKWIEDLEQRTANDIK